MPIIPIGYPHVIGECTCTRCPGGDPNIGRTVYQDINGSGNLSPEPLTLGAYFIKYCSGSRPGLGGPEVMQLIAYAPGQPFSLSLQTFPGPFSTVAIHTEEDLEEAFGCCGVGFYTTAIDYPAASGPGLSLPAGQNGFSVTGGPIDTGTLLFRVYKYSPKIKIVDLLTQVDNIITPDGWTAYRQTTIQVSNPAPAPWNLSTRLALTGGVIHSTASTKGFLAGKITTDIHIFWSPTVQDKSRCTLTFLMDDGVNFNANQAFDIAPDFFVLGAVHFANADGSHTVTFTVGNRGLGPAPNVTSTMIATGGILSGTPRVDSFGARNLRSTAGYVTASFPCKCTILPNLTSINASVHMVGSNGEDYGVLTVNNVPVSYVS